MNEGNINNNSIRSAIIDNYKQYLQKLIKDFNEGKITHKQFLRKAAEPLIKYAHKQKRKAKAMSKKEIGRDENRKIKGES